MNAPGIDAFLGMKVLTSGYIPADMLILAANGEVLHRFIWTANALADQEREIEQLRARAEASEERHRTFREEAEKERKAHHAEALETIAVWRERAEAAERSLSEMRAAARDPLTKARAVAEGVADRERGIACHSAYGPGCDGECETRAIVIGIDAALEALASPPAATPASDMTPCGCGHVQGMHSNHVGCCGFAFTGYVGGQPGFQPCPCKAFFPPPAAMRTPETET